MVSDLPNFNQINTTTQSLNNEFDIKAALNGIIKGTHAGAV